MQQRWCMWKYTVDKHRYACVNTHVYTDKYRHTWDDTKGQQIKIINQYSDADTADMKAAGSANGLGVTKSAKRFLSAFVFGPVHFRHHWIVVKSWKKSTLNVTKICQNDSEQQHRFSSETFSQCNVKIIAFRSGRRKNVNPADWTGFVGIFFSRCLSTSERRVTGYK